MSSVKLIDLQRYWWHLYVERLDSLIGSGGGRAVNPPETNYLPELRPELGRERICCIFRFPSLVQLPHKALPHPHSPCAFLLAKNCHRSSPGIFTSNGLLCTRDAWRKIQKDTDVFHEAISFIRNKENVQVYLYSQ